MIAYDGCHVWHAAVAHFYSAPIEELVVAVVFGEMLVDQAEEFLGHIRGYALVKWWVEPYDFALAGLFLGVLPLWFAVRKAAAKTRFPECILICWFGMVELFLVAVCCRS